LDTWVSTHPEFEEQSTTVLEIGSIAPEFREVDVSTVAIGALLELDDEDVLWRIPSMNDYVWKNCLCLFVISVWVQPQIR
jgi:hypothetical protein